MNTKKKVYYEARLNRNISRSSYGGKKIYKKGTVIWDCTEKQFEKTTAKNIDNYTSLCICEGHGVYEYFDLEIDIEFVRVEKITTTKEKVVKLKK
jgi:hypothetical protein